MNKLCLILFILLLPQTALAWEQSMTCGNNGAPCTDYPPYPTYWEKPCISFHLNEKGTSDISFSFVQQIVKESIEEWNHPEFSSLQTHFSGLTNEDRVGYNPYISQNSNIIVFRDNDTWTESQAMMALTTVTHRNSTGVIYDADIEINTSNFQYGIYEINGSNVVDLQNTLTHEIGHVFGLDHSTDPNATMFPYSTAGETNLRDLSDDDLLAIATVYPKSVPVQCKFKDKYFKKPKYAMDEIPPESSCQTNINHRTRLPEAIYFIWLLPMMIFLRKKTYKNFTKSSR